MKIHFISHSEIEPPGAIEDWAKENSHQLSSNNSALGEPLPNVNDFDFLISLGGPQCTLEMEKYPYLQQELKLILATMEAQKYLLGICLGAQLISVALGAKNERSPFKEIGVFPVSLTSDGRSSRLFKDFEPTFPVMHWHHDMFGVPKNAKLLAYSNGCPRQAIQYNERTYGLQFHLELSSNAAQTLIKRSPEALSEDHYTQTTKQILTADFESMNQKMKLILDRLVNL